VTGTRYTLEIQPVIPPRLARLNDLAADLYYSWDHTTRGLFYSLDKDLWEESRHNPKVFLRRVSQQRLEEASTTRTFLEEYQRVLANYDAYLEAIEHERSGHKVDTGKDLVAYFCAEFGLHESLPVYSGGLGILAGDYCKAASDLRLPFVGVGLLYRNGNFTQTIDENGHQTMHHIPVINDDLPMRPARNPAGEEVVVSIELPRTRVYAKVWQVRAGHTHLYLLDTDIDENSPQDRSITYDLYPGDRHVRFKQEIVLGIGGVRALQQLAIRPTVWHINEGHPCLLLIERWREKIEQGMDFSTALELVASNTVFTTHTPITAGHEVYDTGMIHNYLANAVQALGISEAQFLELGKNQLAHEFDLTSFTLRCSRFHNGVSRIHGDVAASMEQHIWPEIPVDENPISYVTNGVHVPTFLAREWLDLLDDPGWRSEIMNADYWSRIDGIPDFRFWSVHRSLKSNLIRDCCLLIEQRYLRCGQSRIQIDNNTHQLRAFDDVMIIGFARRFASYKRADLLFEFTDRLERILNNTDRPVVLILAGKAHPSDDPGKQIIERIHHLSQQAPFIGKILLLEGYDMALARKLVSSVDLWLNNPEYPMEACGTSGMKAGINGVINLSIADGWWAEAYNGENGWIVQPQSSTNDPYLRRQIEAKELLDILEYEVIPTYFDKTEGYSKRWVKMAKASMKSILPRFNSRRMTMDYINQFYLQAIDVSTKLQAGNGAKAKELTVWKKSINRLWPGLELKRLDPTPGNLKHGEHLTIQVAVNLNGLDSDDIIVECLLGQPSSKDGVANAACYRLLALREENGVTRYEASFVPDMSGLIGYKIRTYPYHPLLCHPLEMGYMKWI